MSINDQIEHFCDECPHCYDCGGIDYAFGAPMYVHELTCDAEGDPEDLGCPERDEYLALLEERDAEEAGDDE